MMAILLWAAEEVKCGCLLSLGTLLYDLQGYGSGVAQLEWARPGFLLFLHEERILNFMNNFHSVQPDKIASRITFPGLGKLVFSFSYLSW